MRASHTLEVAYEDEEADEALTTPDELPVSVDFHDNSVSFSAEGFGSYSMLPGYGDIFFVERHPTQGLRLVVFADINKEDPTHIINLEGARETARLPLPEPEVGDAQ